MALVASNAASAQEAEKLLRDRYPFVPVEEATLRGLGKLVPQHN